MRQTQLLFLLLLASVLSATEVLAQAVGTQFAIGGITYEITKKNLTTHENEVAIVRITGSGTVNVPATVQNTQDLEHYTVTSAQGGSTVGSGVTGIVLPNTLTKIANEAFVQVSGGTSARDLQSVTIPASCTEIGVPTFTGLPKLTSFTVASGNPAFKSENGMLLTANGQKLVSVPSGTVGVVNIPDGITEIGPAALSVAGSVTTVNIPASVTTMYFPDATTGEPSICATGTHFTVAPGNTAYKDIDGVLVTADGKKLCAFPHNYDVDLGTSRKYTVPAGVEEVCDKAFYNSIVKPVELDLNDVKTIGKKAFAGCSDLARVTIGANVTSIGEGAFGECLQITAFDVAEANTTYNGVDGVIFTENGEHLVLYPAARPDVNYTVPAGTKYIDPSAFASVSKLKNIHIAPTVETIGESAFRYSNLESVTFDPTSSVKSIGHHAFNQTKIETITLPASVETIGAAAFYNVQTLKEVYIEDGSKLKTIASNLFQKDANLTTVKFLGSSVANYIGTSTFANCTSLTEFEIPASVRNIDKNAFQDTPSLETVTFKTSASVETINSAAFANSGIKHITLPEGIRSINQQAFDNCRNLETINIPASVTTVGMGAFNMCESLTNISVDESNTRYSSLDGMLCNKDKTTLEVFPAGKADTKYTLVPYFQTVAAYAFYGSEKVTNVTFPRTVTTIENRALALCKNLQSLSFMGTDNVPALSDAIIYNSSNPKNISIYVRKAWYENTANDATIRSYNTTFKEVHPSFVSSRGYDRGTEFFPTSTTNVGAISFYTERTSVILDKNATEDATTTPDRFGKTFPGKTYEVSSILDFAYENTSKVKAIVALADMSYIGLNAFKGSSIRELYFVGNVPGDLGSVDYEQPDSYPFKDGQSIYVKESKAGAYRDKWQIGSHTLDITHKIPQQTSRYGGTVCFPFDVKYPSGQGTNDIRPYVPVDYSHAYDLSRPFVRAYSIDDYYVPAYTGVLIRSKEAVSASSYCQMDEDQNHTEDGLAAVGYNKDGNNRMVGAVEDVAIAGESGYQYYAFSKSRGKFVQLNDGATVPYFKAYFRMADSAASPAKDFSIMFDDDNTVTGIDSITEKGKESDTAPYYNLNGMQVREPAKGVYIRNGKKVIIK